MNEFERSIPGEGSEGLYAKGIDAIQINVGLKCNQSCVHCHLGASPDRDEMMDWTVMEDVLQVISEVRPELVDITGGAPELNPNLKRFITALSDEGFQVQVRTNLTAMIEPETEGLAGFFRDHHVRLVASMPCYLEDNVQAQRGDMVYEKSVQSLQMLNSLGYGIDPGLPLNLVYNPGGAFLPGDQEKLERAYREELDKRFGIRFTNLLTITNMPVGRFQETLRKEQRERRYLDLLRDSFNPATVDGLMCRNQISIGWDGSMYDCDFNLALDLAMNHGAPDHISRFNLTSVAERRIVTGIHCFGCTAGCGSSCAGALVEGDACEVEN